MVSPLLLLVAAAALAAENGAASDPSPLQDFCVADTASKVLVNGLPCKDPATVVPDDFFFSGVDKPGSMANRRYGFTALLVQIPGLNTLGVSHARVDVEPGGTVPPHSHPRATETVLVLEGSVYFGFVTSSPANKLFDKVLRKGDVFAVPQGVVHFLYNNGTATAALYATFGSQNAGQLIPADELFGTGVAEDLLAKAFLTDKETVHKIAAKFQS
ncbi:hypothetical protein ACP70R_034736 [Stipagrostis hirtigluma subsp. patula]